MVGGAYNGLNYTFTRCSGVVKRIGIAVLLFIVVRTAGVVVSPNITSSVNELQFPFYVLVFFSMTAWRQFLDDDDIKRFMSVWMWAAVIACVIGIIKYLMAVESRIGPPFGPIVTNYIHPDQPPLGNYSTMAKFLTFTLTFFALRLFYEKKVGRLVVHSVSLFILACGIFLTFSRSCWFATGVVMSAIVFKLNRWAFLILACLVILTVFFHPYARERVNQSLELSTAFSGRDVLWKIGLDRFMEKPLIGHGIGSFSEIVTSKQRDTLPDKDVGDWHNQYLQLIVESGIVGLIAFLWVIFEMVRGFMISIRNSQDSNAVHLSQSGLALLAGVLIIGFFDVFLSSPVGNVCFWCLTGVAVGGIDPDLKSRVV